MPYCTVLHHTAPYCTILYDVITGTERTPFREKVSEFFGEALVMQAIGMLIMMVLGMVLMYIDGGPAAPPGSPQASNSSLPRHNATIVDSLYFASVSITTVGYVCDVIEHGAVRVMAIDLSVGLHHCC